MIQRINAVPIGNIAQSQKYVTTTRSISNENTTKSIKTSDTMPLLCSKCWTQNFLVNDQYPQAFPTEFDRILNIYLLQRSVHLPWNSTEYNKIYNP